MTATLANASTASNIRIQLTALRAATDTARYTSYESAGEVRMTDEIKPVVSKEETFDKLEIRLGQIVDIQPEPLAPKAAYRLTVDFGKFGRRVSVGRFTKHAIEEIKGRKVLGVLNFEPRQIGDVVSEVLILGVQYPKADSGEATFIVPMADAKIGGKLF